MEKTVGLQIKITRIENWVHKMECRLSGFIESLESHPQIKTQRTWLVFPRASIVTGLPTGGSSYMFKLSMLVGWIDDGQL